ncbi:winged helix-turn-helix transcriptional regulator [Mycolicibacterium farcinogenes]|nr:winged helix-turn-helix transcriptional regulator [Mycolicibacterium farcinogenes]
MTTDSGDEEPCARGRGGDNRITFAVRPVTALPVVPSVAVIGAAGELLRVLAAPVRIAIVLHLNESPRYVHEIAEALQTPQSLVSQHLRILKAARVVAGERVGRQVRYRLVDDHLAHIVVAAVVHVAECSAIS